MAANMFTFFCLSLQDIHVTGKEKKAARGSGQGCGAQPDG